VYCFNFALFSWHVIHDFSSSLKLKEIFPRSFVIDKYPVSQYQWTALAILCYQEIMRYIDTLNTYNYQHIVTTIVSISNVNPTFYRTIIYSVCCIINLIQQFSLAAVGLTTVAAAICSLYYPILLTNSEQVQWISCGVWTISWGR
jgi:hypothetical protein